MHKFSSRKSPLLLLPAPIIIHLDGERAAAGAEDVARLGRLAEAEHADAEEILEALLEARDRARLRGAHRRARVVVPAE